MKIKRQPCEICKRYVSVNAASHVGICIAQNEWHLVEGSDRPRFCCEYQPKMQGGAKNGQQTDT